MTTLTLVIDTAGRIYNLANNEHPLVIWGNEKKLIVKGCSIPKNAFCCSEEEYVEMMRKRGQKIESSGKTLAEIEKERKENGIAKV